MVLITLSQEESQRRNREAFTTVAEGQFLVMQISATQFHRFLFIKKRNHIGSLEVVEVSSKENIKRMMTGKPLESFELIYNEHDSYQIKPTGDPSDYEEEINQSRIFSQLQGYYEKNLASIQEEAIERLPNDKDIFIVLNDIEGEVVYSFAKSIPEAYALRTNGIIQLLKL